MSETDIAPVEGGQGERSAQWGFRPDIEGLRAVAVLAVVLFHAEIPGVGGGYIGVDVFFVISGFLITGLLWRDVSNLGTVRSRRFYGARARRLLPASATVGVVTAIASVLLLPPLQVRSALIDGIASALYVGNYSFALQLHNYFDANLPPSPFQHYWSLGVEEQFYLVWPPMIIVTAWLIRRVYRRRTEDRAGRSQRPYLALLALVAAASFALSLLTTQVVPAIAFFSLPTRAWQLAVGGLVALTVVHWRRLSPTSAAITGWAGMIVILLACTLLSTNTLYPGTAALLPTLGTALVIGAGCASPSGGCGRILGLAPMQAIGRLSYSWYLWHWPVLLFAPLLLGHALDLPLRLVAVLVSAALAVLTFKLIENPLRFAAPLRRSPGRSLALGAGVSAVAVGVCMALMAAIPVPLGRGEPRDPLVVTASPPVMGLTGRGPNAYDAAVQAAFEQIQTAVADSVDLEAVPSNLNPPLVDAAGEIQSMVVDGCMRTFFQSGQPECATGDTSSATTVALVGDSHAAMWAPAFQRIAEQRSWRLEMLNKAGCPLMDLPIPNPFRRWVSECEKWRGEAIARLRAEPLRLVVLSVWRGYGAGSGYLPGFTSYDQAWLDSLSRLVQQLTGTGAKVLVLGPVPDLHALVPTCLSGHLDDATACSAARSTAVNASGIAAETAATKAGGGQYVDVTNLFCTADRCPPIVGNTLVYFDEHHVTVEYARVLAPVMAALADRALNSG